MIIIDPATVNDIEPLRAAAAEDAHPICLPSHIIRKDGDIVGYVSFVTAMHGWLHTRRVNAFETFRTVFPTIDDIARSRGDKFMFYLTGRQSNLTPFAERIGYSHVGSTELFAKQLN